MTTATIGGLSPYFIVSDVSRAFAFYCDRLGFEIGFQGQETDPFFGIVQRDGVMLFLKSDPSVEPLPNPRRHPWMAWDAYAYTPDPDALAAEFARRGAPFLTPLADNDDGLRGFEIADPDGYVIFFGRPRP